MRLPMSVNLPAALFLLVGVSQAQHGTAPNTQITPSSGKDMCAVLSPVDFTKAGVSVTGAGGQSNDDSTNAYCEYQDKDGKVELDIFYPAGDTAAAAIGTERTVYREVGGHFQPVSVPGTDSAQINLAVPGKKLSASIVVRRGTAVFTLNIPQNANARQQLLSLAQTALGRLPPRDKSAK
ncbi:MAG: hypothetical protein WA876_10425 [Candidatus Acidiferrales bacterium]